MGTDEDRLAGPRADRFLALAQVAALAGKKKVFGQLLGNGRAPGHGLALFLVLLDGALDSLRHDGAIPQKGQERPHGNCFRPGHQLEREWQRDRFIQHIQIAKQCNKPLIIHTREAKADTIALLRSEGAEAVGGVMHCFTEDWAMAKAAMDLGFYISFSGIITFKNAAELKSIAQTLPLQRLLIETDSPYLAPQPFRGKPNQPAYVRYVAEYLAELRDCSLEDIANQTTTNFFTLFKQAQHNESVDRR